ncbi:inositol monophosphatase [Microvirga sp. W0021]|uniref:Inositol monophosphatase n=1 Tax=Hohaiivirga grylli TaxID=3133970 RepID=A0ABV0BGQ6_9HYPH
MALPANLRDNVVEVMREAAQTIILPRYQHLAGGEVEEKSPGELVTVADKESELFISEHLRKILPGSFVIGEELAEVQPDVVDRVDQGMVWLVDPLDGTANFVASKPLFSVMVALMVEGEPTFAFMLNPVTGVLHHAEKGNGAYRDDVRLKTSQEKMPVSEIRGAMLNRLLPPEMKSRMAQRGKLMKECLPGFGCAGIEYPTLVEGGEECVIFWRSLPWDHVPGALFVREAGGVSKRLNGRDYKASEKGKGLIVACNEHVYEEVCDKVIGRDAW